MRVKFIVSPNYNSRGKTINPAYWFLKTYYKYSSKHYEKISWLFPHFDYITDIDKVVDIILQEQVDILCLSIYLWNKSQYIEISKKIKRLNPKIIIVAGGPELDAHTNKNFWLENDVLDYIIYGDGEFGFKCLLDHLIAGETLEQASNLVTKTHIYPFKIFNNPIFSEKSPWLENKEDIIRLVNEKKENENILLNWEMSRGCPYQCSFCDWTSGLHNKVKRRKANWKEEIDLFAQLNLSIGIIDANWGIYKEDIKIHDYAVKKLKEKLFTTNYSKLNKKTVYQMIAKQASVHKSVYSPSISLQDINPIVLKNIDRPEISWEEHKLLLKKLMNENSNIMPMPELIIGLPGQTISSIIDTVTELHSIGIKKILNYPWFILTNSPAAKKDYQEKNKLIIDELVMLANTVKFDSRESAINSYRNNSQKTFKTKIVTETYSCNFTEILLMHNIISLYNAIMNVNPNLKPFKIINSKKDKLYNLSQKHAAQIKKDKIFGASNNTGFVDYCNIWDLDNFNLSRALKDI